MSSTLSPRGWPMRRTKRNGRDETLAARRESRCMWREAGRRSEAHRHVNVTRVKAYCRSFAGVSETLHGDPWNFLVYTVGGSKFAYFKTSAPERWRFSVRVTPDRFVEL